MEAKLRDTTTTTSQHHGPTDSVTYFGQEVQNFRESPPLVEN